MTETLYIRRDPALRLLLSNPRIDRGSFNTPLGYGAVRLAVAGADAAQVVVLGLVTGPLFGQSHILWTTLLGCLVSALALVIRRGLRTVAGPLDAGLTRAWLRAGLAVMAAWMFILAVDGLLGHQDASAGASWIVCWAAASTIVSAGLRTGPFRIVTARILQPRVAVVGPRDETGLLTSILTEQDRYKVVAQMTPDSASDMARLEEMAVDAQIDMVVLTGTGRAQTQQICLALGHTRVHICLGSDALLYMSTNLDAPKLSPFLLPLLPSPADDWRRAVKRVTDILIVLALTPLLIPVMAFAALAITLESSGPILFRQWRFGLGGRPTRVLKFRTMFHDRADVTGEARTLARDPRVTRVGRILRRTSIDELPQLLNVLRGEMSLVGPRPHATHMKVEGDYYFEAVDGYRLRHRVKPGITGWAQVTGSRGEVDTLEKARDRIEKDLWYIRNWSLTLDFRILVMTALGGFASPNAD